MDTATRQRVEELENMRTPFHRLTCAPVMFRVPRLWHLHHSAPRFGFSLRRKRCLNAVSRVQFPVWRQHHHRRSLPQTVASESFAWNALSAVMRAQHGTWSYSSHSNPVWYSVVRHIVCARSQIVPTGRQQLQHQLHQKQKPSPPPPQPAIVPHGRLSVKD